MDQLVKLPNRIAERQRLYQTSTLPIYLRQPRSRLYVGLWFGGLGVGLLGITYGAASLIAGHKQE